MPQDFERSATIRDVAAVSGVSVGTVSRSLNAPETVRPVTLEKVRAAIQELGFRPDARAQNMRRRNTMTIGFIVNDILNPVHAMVFKGAEAELRESGYSLHLINTGGKARQEAEAIELLQHGRVDGLLMTINSEQDPRCIERLEKLRVPSVLLDREIALETDAVRTDHAWGMEQAISYLLDLGHRRIGLITAGTEILPGRERIRGFTNAFVGRGMPVPTELIRSQSLSADFGFRETVSFLRSPDRPTALVAGGNQLLVGVLRAIEQQGVSIPRDLSLVTCDRTDLASVYPGSITAIDRDIPEIGRTAAQLLLERINGPANWPARSVMLPTRLVLGKSCAPAGAVRLAATA
ncbi:MAG TPA: substrate-binding domain-containing protein [Bauldia sp.]|jgi:LacI family transcriptional regulator